MLDENRKEKLLQLLMNGDPDRFSKLTWLCIHKKYLELLDYSDRNSLPNDIIIANFDQPMILQEKQSKLKLAPIRFVHEDRSILSNSFEVKLSNNFPLSVARSINIVGNGNSEESIVSIETQIKESLVGNFYYVAVNEIALKTKVLNKIIKQENNIEVSGVIVYCGTGDPFANKTVILQITQSQRYGCMHKIQVFTQEFKTDQKGFFKTTVSGNKLRWKSEPFNILFSIKFVTELLIKYTDPNEQTQNEKVALISISRINDSKDKQ